MSPTPTLPSLEAAGEAAAIPADILSAASECAERIACGGIPGETFRDAVITELARALLAERRKHDHPTSPDLQAEAERVFYKVDKTPWKDDAIEIIAKALQAAKDEEREICALICEAMASTDSEWPEADAALRRAAKNIRGA